MDATAQDSNYQALSASPCLRALRNNGGSLLKRNAGVGLGFEQDALEVALDAGQRGIAVALEAQHQHGRGVGGAHEAEAVRVLDAQPVDRVHVGRAVELRALLQALDEAVVVA